MNNKKWYNCFEDFIGSWLLLIMCVMTFVNVLSRFIFHATIAATEEIVTLLFVLLSLFGAAVAAKRRAHLGLTLLTDRLPWKVNKYIFAFGYLCAAVFCGILVWKGIDMVKTSLRYNTVTLAMNWPEWIFTTFVPIGGAVIGIRYIQLIFVTLAMDKDPKTANEEEKQKEADDA